MIEIAFNPSTIARKNYGTKLLNQKYKRRIFSNFFEYTGWIFPQNFGLPDSIDNR